ncbi:MAG: CHASE2 domain-containing protein, partial [Rhodospirillaceae bacterium]|nr:CHASE2 domain-containing protein [Rhodospirillaceae bacterium]
TRTASPDVVVVAIDPKSLAALGAWPWPRSRHAEVIDRLHQLGANLIAVDIDLSSAGDPADDRALAETLARYRENTILAAFTQQEKPSAQLPTRLLSQPLDMFRAPAGVATIVLRPDADGRIRRMPLFEDTGKTLAPTFSTALASGSAGQPPLFYVDLSFDPATVPMLSYIDVLNGDVPAETVRDRQVVIGVTSSQLGTHVPVPRYRALPATLVHVLAAQSLLNGRALVRPTSLFTLLVTAVLVFGLWQLSRRSQKLARTALLCGGVIAGSFGLSFAVYAASPVLLDTAPWMFAAFLVFIAGTIEQLHRERQRIVALAREQRTSSRFMQLVFNTIGEAVLTVDMHANILSANAAALRMFGQSRKAMLGQDIRVFFPTHLNDGTFSDNFSQQLATTDRPKRRVAQRSGGTVFPVDVTARELTSGQPGFVITVEDLSEYVEAENQRDTIQRQLLDAMESFGEPFAMFNASDRLIVCNSAFRRLHSENPNICEPGTPFAQILGTAMRSGLFDITEQEEEGWRTQRHELRAGTTRKLVRTIPISENRWLRVVDQKTSEGGFITILFDVTDTKQHEQSLARAKNDAEVANLAKSQFLANMSHELRTPLNAVIGFSEMMIQEIRGPIENPQYAGDAQAIHESAHHLLRIINDILDLSQIEAGTLVLDEQETDISELLASVCRLLDSHARSIDLELDLNIAENLPSLWVDPRITKQVFINLLSNAVKFSHAGASVTIDASHLPSGEVEISVADTGMGIAPEHLDVAFEPFGQVENALTRTHDGVGLGLPLSKMFCDALGVELLFDSAPNRGTTVKVRFPADRIHGFRVASE